MAYLNIDEDLSLRPLRKEDATGIFHILDTYRDNMRRWLPFVDSTLSVEDSEAFTESVEFGDEEVFAIIYKGQFAGIIGFKYSEPGNNRTEIGYWLSPEFQRLGIMTRCVRTLCGYAFETLGMHRIAIKCAVGNTASIAIPQKLGFRLEGIERDGELLCDGNYTDIESWSLLSDEFDLPRL